MSIVDRTQNIVVPYSLDDTFSALKKALPKLIDFKVDHFDDVTNTAHLKAGVSLFSWGENMTVSLAFVSGGTSVSILSTPKTGIMLGGALDMGKNRRNISKIMTALSSELAQFEQIAISSNTDIETEMRKIKALLDDGVITQEDFDAKKKQLLNL